MPISGVHIPAAAGTDGAGGAMEARVGWGAVRGSCDRGGLALLIGLNADGE